MQRRLRRKASVGGGGEDAEVKKKAGAAKRSRSLFDRLRQLVSDRPQENNSSGLSRFRSEKVVGSLCDEKFKEPLELLTAELTESRRPPPPPPPPISSGAPGRVAENLGASPSDYVTYLVMQEGDPSHLPFHTGEHYRQVAAVEDLGRDAQMAELIGYGRYYIEKDWLRSVWPWQTPAEVARLESENEKLRGKYRACGRVNRVVQLFMSQLLQWTSSPRIDSANSVLSKKRICLLWLGRGRAQAVLRDLCLQKDTTEIFKKTVMEDYSEFTLVNRLPLDVFFNDKAALFHLLRRHVMTVNLTCGCQVTAADPTGEVLTCVNSLYPTTGSTRTCVHQNLSLSLKPCAVKTCPNYGRPLCRRLQVFVPETFVVTSYTSMLRFCDRFQRAEDLKGCVFVTKPAYVDNARGIRFFLNKDQFEYFYHMSRGKATPRHGVLLQRYIDTPRLFAKRKFSIRFFVLIVVLKQRRVVGFIHPGVAFLAEEEYQLVEREPFSAEEDEAAQAGGSVALKDRTIGRVTTKTFAEKSHITNFMRPTEWNNLRRHLRKGKANFMRIEQDTCHYLGSIVPSNCVSWGQVQAQMLFIAQRLLESVQTVIDEYAGAFETVAVDALLDARNKLWLLGASTKIFRSMRSCAPRQRLIMSAIVQETLGLAVECAYRSAVLDDWKPHYVVRHSAPFCFQQNFHFFYETDRRRLTIQQLRPKRQRRDMTVEERYDRTDRQMDRLLKQKKCESVYRKRMEAWVKERRLRLKILYSDGH